MGEGGSRVEGKAVDVCRRKTLPVGRALVAVGLSVALLPLSCAEPRRVGGRDDPLFRFVHLTDTHCMVTEANPRPPPPQAYVEIGGFKLFWTDPPNSLPNLEHTVAYLNKSIQPDFVIHGGDVTSGGDLSNLRRARELLDQLDCPYYVVMGDNDLGMTEAEFQKDPGASNFVRVFGSHNRLFDRAGRHFIMLSACATERDFAWLARDLERNREKPTFLCTHRLLLADQVTSEMVARYYRGARLMMSGGEGIEALLEGYPNVRFILSGHCHCSLLWRNRGRTCVTTAALAGVPVEFSVFTVYSGRVEIQRYRAATAGDVRAGRWRMASSQLISLQSKQRKGLQGGTGVYREDAD